MDCPEVMCPYCLALPGGSLCDVCEEGVKIAHEQALVEDHLDNMKDAFDNFMGACDGSGFDILCRLGMC